MSSFDTVVVGGGPAGLTLATYLPGKTCLIEHESIGGCHRVRRDRGLFAEHGPRVYSGAYVNVAEVLRDIGTSFRETFRPYKFSPENIDGKRWFTVFSPREMIALSIAFCRYVYDTRFGKDVTMLEWCGANGFGVESIRYVDAVCSFSDGADASRYSLNEFLSGFDQHTLYGFYEPRRPHDKHLFPLWKTHLEKIKGVKIVRAHVDRALHENGRVGGVRTSDGKTFSARAVIFAIPPASLVPVLKNSNLAEPGFERFSRATKYDPYWSVAYHFERDARVLDHEGFRSTPWGIIYLDMPFADERYKVLSVAATKWNVPSPATGKTLKQHMKEKNDDAIIAEIERQLRLPSKPVRAAIPTGTYFDTAFVAAARAGHWPAKLACCSGLFSVGTHNGLSDYRFTSMESAVQNALAFCGKKRRQCVHVSDALRILATLVFAAVVARTFVVRRTTP